MSSRKPSTREVEPKKGSTSPCWSLTLAAVLLCFGVLLAYANSIKVPFVFDDTKGIVHNETIRSLWPLSEVLSPPQLATGAGGRPIVNLSLAVNYAIGGLDPRGYHVFNMIAHALSALVLLGLLRRTFERPVLQERLGKQVLPLAFTVSFLWALHPLLTESVTGVIQRTEVLGGLFYLLTLYCFVRGTDGANARRWQVLCVASALVGMATKEIMATVPVIALLYDRTFVAGTFKAAWQRRRGLYVALMATWGLLAWLVIENESRGGMVGFGLGMSSWDYALTQCRAIILYLKLSFWPHPLVLDYGAEVVNGIGAVWWQGILLLGLVGGTFWALVRRPMVGFVAFTFFSILAPSSSFVPLTTQTIAEHRMYLPLAAVLVLVVAGAYGRWGRWVIPVGLGLALCGGLATAQRNQDYRSVVVLWKDTVEKVPENPRAQVNLAASYLDEGRLKESVEHLEAALALKPDSADARYNYGNTFLRMERYEEAVAQYRKVIEVDPDYGMAYYGLGYCLVREQRVQEAVAAFEKAHELRPKDATVLHSLASSLAFAGRLDEAMLHYRELEQMTPEDESLPAEIGSMLAQAGRWEEALGYLNLALRARPQDARLRYSAALAQLELKRYATAANELRQVLQTHPNFPEGRHALGRALLGMERWDAAVEQFEQALRLRPDFTEARHDLDRAELLRDLRR